ncbi:TIGR02530 family flagellar biosynthesis protein [Alkalihalobacillus pseudalcaliphilus]|uniref:TIGR02530 family flagellar biosynthesis protein n=1 Tax=Alkalihalobacillus pseudalcaliphilus TaxID=79884 RepID=UPI00064E0A2F|nr:TIGR02530 family flagellar biosynthesis protein [Alkalihalobacillus pseudalcaliphilus]KMK77357.1 flagellar protein [Alkalihalobacillus pseudalcaliphilus]
MDKQTIASLQALHPHPLPIKHSERKGDTSFKDLFLKELSEPLKVSKHAKGRMEERGIVIGAQTWDMIHQKIKQAQKMGVQDSLVLTNDAALIISAKNETVITALNREEANEQIFTNINGTILIND